MIALLLSVLVVLLIWYVLRTILQSHPPPLQRIVDLAAAVFVLILALRYFGLI